MNRRWRAATTGLVAIMAYSDVLVPPRTTIPPHDLIQFRVEVWLVLMFSLVAITLLWHRRDPEHPLKTALSSLGWFAGSFFAVYSSVWWIGERWLYSTVPSPTTLYPFGIAVTAAEFIGMVIAGAILMVACRK